MAFKICNRRLAGRVFAALLILGVSVGTLPFLSPGVFAQSNVMRIAAVVNDDIISVLDVEQRLRLAALVSNIELDAQASQRLLPQILRTLIDERLQLQEAEQNGVSVTERELNQELTAIAERNNIPPLQFASILGQQGVSIDALRSQVEAQIAWQKYIGRRLVRQVEVGQEEIDDEIARLRSVADQPQKRVFEIFLGIDNVDNAAEIRQNAERLLSQIVGGADFSSIARNFSQSSTSEQGGDIGWIAPGQLPEELDEALASMGEGMVSQPIRTLTGFYILYVTDIQFLGRNEGETTIDLVQVMERLPQEGREAAKAAAQQELAAAGAQLSGCEALQSFGEQRATATVASANGIRLEELPPTVRDAVSPLGAGDVSAPIDTGNTIVLIGICAREDAGITLPTREQVQDRILREKIDLLARRVLRDLRREAFIDVRI